MFIKLFIISVVVIFVMVAVGQGIYSLATRNSNK